MNTDHISIRGLKVYAYHGVLKAEKDKGQYFYVDADLFLDLREAGRSDDLSKTVDYSGVCTFIENSVKDDSFDLIESVAQKLADGLLLRYGSLSKVNVSINKPDAPVGAEVSNISVNITRGWSRAVIAMGSNMGDKEVYINDALCKLKKDPFIKGLSSSKLIITKPYGGVDQDDFLNGAAIFSTLYSPHELLRVLNGLESEAKRERTVHWGPRTLDLDIIFYEDMIINDPDLTIPHPDMENRDFVLAPLMELCQYYVNPINGKSVKTMFESLKDR